MAFRTGNPVLKDSTFSYYRTEETVEVGRLGGEIVSRPDGVMTIEGTVHRTFFLLCLVVAAAATTWGLVATKPELIWPTVIASSIASFVVALVTIFKKQWSPYTSPVYAVLEGLALGAISSVFEFVYPGVVIPSVALTFGTLFALLAAYRSGLVKATENFKLGVTAATGGIALFYLVSLVMRFGFGVDVPLLHEGGMWGILFSLFVVGVAAMNLVLYSRWILPVGCLSRGSTSK